MSVIVCERCAEVPSAGVCCTSHGADPYRGSDLCHRCYRLTHFVEICGEACADCAREGLDPGTKVR